MGKVLGAIALVVLFSLNATAAAEKKGRTGSKRADPVADESVQYMNPFDFTSRFTVKVDNRLASIYSGEQNAGHGTGFFVGTRKNENGEEIGIIFTNRHVIENEHHGNVQQLSVEFSTDSDIGEKVDVKLVFVSRTLDFAVVEFKMSDLKRVKNKIAAAPLPPADSPLYQFSKNFRTLQGRPTLAQGNPLASQAVTTFGQISGFYRDWRTGDFIQTQTPINPGNSGGPLIDLESNMVIGMNTAKVLGADNVGFAIPIGVVLDEYKSWLENPRIARHKHTLLRLGIPSKSALSIVGAAEAIERHFPEFFNRYQAAMSIMDSEEGSPLKAGDILVKTGGELLPPSLHEFSRRVQRAEQHLDVEVIRDGKLVKTRMPVYDGEYRHLRSRVDFVYMSGLMFGTFSDAQAWMSDHSLKTRVILEGRLFTSDINFNQENIPAMGSVLVRINLEGKTYEIESLTDLKRVLNDHPGAKFARLDVRQPITVFNQDGEVMAVSNRLGVLAFEGTVSSHLIPLTEILTPLQFSKHGFVKQYSFASDQPNTRNWRSFIRADRRSSRCDEALAPAPAMKTTSVANPNLNADGSPRRMPPVKEP